VRCSNHFVENGSDPLVLGSFKIVFSSVRNRNSSRKTKTHLQLVSQMVTRGKMGVFQLFQASLLYEIVYEQNVQAK